MTALQTQESAAAATAINYAIFYKFCGVKHLLYIIDFYKEVFYSFYLYNKVLVEELYL